MGSPCRVRECTTFAYSTPARPVLALLVAALKDLVAELGGAPAQPGATPATAEPASQPVVHAA